MRHGAFRVIPVIDVMHGQAVHAVGGIRSHYRPVRSILHPSSLPLEIARAYLNVLGLSAVYLADLDAITRNEPNRSLYGDLLSLGIDLWIDAGVQTKFELEPLLGLDQTTVVVGLESVGGPEELAAILERAGAPRVVFSLDIFEGMPRVSASASWPSVDLFRLSRMVIDLGVRRLLLLELSRVGTGQGTGTDTLRTALLDARPDIQVMVGGGISGIGEVLRLRDEGAAAVLVGSAIHDGRIGCRELDRLTLNQSESTPLDP
jgi:phosphoribosylformimino-5-aminoimidazole carboxamide ribotide isomerase